MYSRSSAYVCHTTYHFIIHFAWQQAILTFIIICVCRGPPILLQCAAVNIRFWKWFPLARVNATHLTTTLFTAHPSSAGETEVTTAWRLPTPPPFHFVFRVEDYYSTFWPLTCSTSKNHMDSDVVNLVVTFSCLLSCHQNTVQHTELFSVWAYTQCCWKRHSSLSIRHVIKKWFHNVTYLCEFMVLPPAHTKKGPIILSVLVTHYMANFTTCNSPSWINMGFSAYQYTLFSEFTYWTSWNQALPLNGKNMGSVSPSWTAWRHHHFRKFTPAKWKTPGLCDTVLHVGSEYIIISYTAYL